MATTVFTTILLTLLVVWAIALPIVIRRRRALESTTRVIEELSISRAGTALRADTSAPGDYGRLARKANELAASLEMARKQAELERQHLAALLTHADELVIATDSTDRVALINPAAATALGRTFAEMTGKNIEDLFPQKEIVELYQAAAKSEATLPISADVRIPTRNRLIYCHFTAVAMRTTEAYRGTLLLIRDMTEITQAVQMKTDFVANASHELRTPLSSIRAAVETINEAGIDDREITRRCVDIIGGHALRLQMMVQDLLDLSRTEDPRAVVRHDRVDLVHIAEMVAAMFAPVTGEKHVALDTALADDARSVRGDERLILLILKNLVDNALKFTAAGGQVHIRSGLRPRDALPVETRKTVRPVREWLALEVTDTGCGISPQDQQRVFERFYTVNRSRGGADRGTGLGLAIVKHAASAMGGSVQLESQLNVGTTVSCFLPVYETAAELSTNGN